MKTKNLILFSLLLLSAQAVSLQAQITIGSQEEPAEGALLHIKQPGSENNASSTKGLGMPRVKLTDFHNLYPMFEPDSANYKIGTTGYTKATEDINHIGLMVYHTDECTMLGAGLYIWEKEGWMKLDSDQSPRGLSLNIPTLEFASGQDLRTLVAQPFSVTWSPTSASIAAPTWAYQKGSYGELNFTTLTPASGSLTTSPQTMSVLPMAMTPAEISDNPFLTKDRKVVFTFSECNNMTAEIAISQTNKALRVNGSATSLQILHTANATNRPISVSSNAQWTMSMLPVASATSAVVPSIAVDTVYGTELNNGTGQTIENTYNIQVAATKDRYTTLVFSDSQNSKRFNDVKINIAQCAGTTDLTMKQWATQLGTAEDEIAPNGVAWHRDQNGSYFLSMNYDASNPMGSNNRWMITNLAASYFASTGRTGSDNTIVQSFGNSPSADSNYLTPIWAFPKANATVVVGGEGASTEFKNRERLGRLYNWAAATNSLGGTSNGQNVPGDALGNQTYPSHRKIQGICPNGWHLPSDYEWTELENAIILKTGTYSATPDIASPILISSNNTGSRGKHGKAMIDTCEPTSGFGTSNSPLDGGFSVLLAGLAQLKQTFYYGTNSYFWTASHNKNSTRALSRGFTKSTSSVDGIDTNRDNLFSVRCKMDN